MAAYDNHLKRLGEIIDLRIKERGLSITEVAKGVGTTRPTLYAYIGGSTSKPNIALLSELEIFLNFEPGSLLQVARPDKDPEARILSTKPRSIPFVQRGGHLCDHISPWCARCVQYFRESREIVAYHPYAGASVFRDPLLQGLELEKVLGWSVPVHRDGCPSEEMELDVKAATVRLDSILRSQTGKLENLANIAFHRGNLNVNIAMRLTLSQRKWPEGATIDLAKAVISNGGSSESEVIGPILSSRMPAILPQMTESMIRVLLGLGNRARNIGNPDMAETHWYEKARLIINENIRKESPRAKVLNAVNRRVMTVSQRLSSNEAKKVIEYARDAHEQYGLLTAYHNVGWNDFRNADYVPAEGNFRAMFQNPHALVSWWHRMAGYNGLGATLYASDPGKCDEALLWCLQAEYISAMLGLRVDVTRGIDTIFLGFGKLLSPSAVVRKIGKERKVSKEKMEELRRIALIDSGLQKELLAELRFDFTQGFPIGFP